MFVSDSRIDNPIVESETVKPVQGGELFEKLGEKPDADDEAAPQKE